MWTIKAGGLELPVKSSTPEALWWSLLHHLVAFSPLNQLTLDNMSLQMTTSTSDGPQGTSSQLWDAQIAPHG